MCKDFKHAKDIDEFYNNIMHCLSMASEETIPTSKNVSDLNIPGWDEVVKTKHDTVREFYTIWRDSGKSRQGIYFENMKFSRAQFKYALRQCRLDEDRHTADALAESLNHKDSKTFWSSVDKLNRQKVPLANCVGGVTGDANIAKA